MLKTAAYSTYINNKFMILSWFKDSIGLLLTVDILKWFWSDGFKVTILSKLNIKTGREDG